MKKGFTLIELLIVTVIVGVLMAVAAPKFYIALERGRSAEGLRYIEQVATDLNAYYMAHGKYPTGADLQLYTNGDYSTQYPRLKHFEHITAGGLWISRKADNKVWIRLKRRGFYAMYGHLHDGTLTGITCTNGPNDDRQTSGNEFARYCQQLGFKQKGTSSAIYQMEIVPGFRDAFCEGITGCAS